MADALKKGSRVTGAERDRLVDDLRKKYDAGQSIRTLAAASGTSYGFVHRMLSESGVTLRRRGSGPAARGKERPARKPPRESALDALVREGVVEAPRVAKSAARLPKRLAMKGGLSEIVIAQRG